MRLSSPAFEHEGLIPKKHTCDGENLSPPLSIAEIPRGARSLVLIVEDPDVPKRVRPDGVWDHWVVYNVLPTVREIREGQEPPGEPGAGTSGSAGYYGPCPPDREHRYYFNLYALDTRLSLGKNPTKAQLLEAMKGHVLERATLMGRYDRQR